MAAVRRSPAPDADEKSPTAPGKATGVVPV